jgi:hypothetical protein
MLIEVRKNLLRGRRAALVRVPHASVGWEWLAQGRRAKSVPSGFHACRLITQIWKAR